MMMKSEMTLKEVSPPVTYWCKSGHKADENTLFFHVSSDKLPKERWGVYCEECLKAAHKRAAELKASGMLPVME